MESYFKPLTGKVKKTKFLTIDIESKDGSSRTRPGFTRPFLVGVYDGQEYHEFRDLNPRLGAWDQRYFHEDGCMARAMKHVLRERYAGWHIYAHNAGRFDYLHILPWLMGEGERLGFTFQVIPVSSSIQVLDVYTVGGEKTRHRWRFLDSFKLIPTGFDKAAKSFGLSGKELPLIDPSDEKLSDKERHQKVLRLHEGDPRWSPYLRQDCVGLYALLGKFHGYVENVLGGEVGITAPSTAIKLIRRKHLKRSIPRSVGVHDFIRSGYFGGRVEVFRSEGQGLRYYDINSSYPRSMLEPMPVGEAQSLDGEPPAWLREKWVGFVEADVFVPEDIIVPPLPVRAERVTLPTELRDVAGKLIFPVGRLRGIWEWGELRRAVELGATIERWGRSTWFEGGDLFGDFVREIYSYRDKSNPAYDEGLAQVAKIMLNSAYGKFGMRLERRTIHRYDDPELPEDATPAYPEPDCPIFYVDKQVDACYVMPQVSARVTALSRVRLLDGLVEAKQRGGEIYYCDTDSIVTDVEIATSTALGEWKDEFPEHSGKIHGRFIGPKLYVMTAPGTGWEAVKAKGFEERSVAVLEKLQRGEVIWQRRLEKVGTMARNGFQVGPKMRTVPRSIHLGATKREHLSDGATKPWRLEMW